MGGCITHARERRSNLITNPGFIVECDTKLFLLYLSDFSLLCSRFGAMSLYGSDTLSVCKGCDARISEMVEFLNNDRVHMQQGIFPDVQQSYILHSQLNFDEVSCKVLVGAPLKQNEFLKIDQTCLADVISEEAGNEYLREGSPVLEKKKKGEEEGGKGEGGEGPRVRFEEETVVPKEEEKDEVRL